MATDPEFYKIKPERKKAEIILAKFKVGDTKSSKKFSIGGLADKEVYRYVSEEAYRHIKAHTPKLLIEDGPIGSRGLQHRSSYGKALRIDHMIPTELVYDWLSKQDSLSLSKVELIAKRLNNAIITKDEDKRLSGNGLRADLPKGANLLTCSITARHTAVKIKFHDWG